MKTIQIFSFLDFQFNLKTFRLLLVPVTFLIILTVNNRGFCTFPLPSVSPVEQAICQILCCTSTVHILLPDKSHNPNGPFSLIVFVGLLISLMLIVSLEL